MSGLLVETETPAGTITSPSTIATDNNSRHAPPPLGMLSNGNSNNINTNVHTNPQYSNPQYFHLNNMNNMNMQRPRAHTAQYNSNQQYLSGYSGQNMYQQTQVTPQQMQPPPPPLYKPMQAPFQSDSIQTNAIHGPYAMKKVLTFKKNQKVKSKHQKLYKELRNICGYETITVEMT
eukprot:342597_1